MFTRLHYNSLKELDNRYTYHDSKKSNIDGSSEKCITIMDSASVDPSL